MDDIIVLLEDGTIGKVEAMQGTDIATVSLHDENGNKIFVTGKIKAYL